MRPWGHGGMRPDGGYRRGFGRAEAMGAMGRAAGFGHVWERTQGMESTGGYWRGFGRVEAMGAMGRAAEVWAYAGMNSGNGEHYGSSLTPPPLQLGSADNMMYEFFCILCGMNIRF